MPIFVVGLNHRSTSLAVREKFAVSLQELADCVRAIRFYEGVAGCIALSTCNRTEIFVDAPSDLCARQWFESRGRTYQLNTDTLFVLRDQAAIDHVFRLASGLDSAVLGEPQILGQLKHAAQVASGVAPQSQAMSRLMQQAFASSKIVRSTTAVGEASVSFAGAATRLAQRLFGDLKGLKLLLVGAGEMSELFGKHFRANGLSDVTVANRSEETGRVFAASMNAPFVSLSAMVDALEGFDLVVSATGATTPIIGKGAVERALRARKHRPMFMVDLAVPRDIEAEVSSLRDVYLYTIDDLGKLSQQNSDKRSAAAQEAKLLIDQHVQHYLDWLQRRSKVPLVQELQQRAQQYQNEALEKARRQLATGVDTQQVLETLARGLSNKFLHHPMRAIQSTYADAAAIADAIELLFPVTDEATGNNDKEVKE